MPKYVEPLGKGYALWLVPEEPIFTLLARKISRLSQKLSTPLFEPHVTLLGGITAPEEEIVGKLASLASWLRPFRIELEEIGYCDEYFRCLFFSVVRTDPVIKAHRAARETFNLRHKEVYMPHLSLFYGRLRVDTKMGIAAACSLLSGQSFRVLSLKLYRVSGSPHEWNRIATFDLR